MATISTSRRSSTLRRRILCLLWWLLTIAGSAMTGFVLRAQSTIDAATNNSSAWGANFGWTNWRPSAASGVVIGEYICSGYIYSANAGWINLGSGAAANKIYYANNSASDFGVNFQATTTSGVAALRGLAYGANIGWINFEDVGNARLDLTTGQFSGYAYSANCGWINLGTGTTYVVKTNSITPGVDTNGNGIPDAWEILHFGRLLTLAESLADSDGDGMSNLNEYLEGTDPLALNDKLRITSVSQTLAAGNNNTTLTFTSNATRLYRIETTTSLLQAGAWTDSGLGLFSPDGGATTTRQVVTAAAPQRFYRVRALRPLLPP